MIITYFNIIIYVFYVVNFIFLHYIQALPLGTEGVVKCIDNAGTIHVRWDTGSSLGLVPGVDRWEVIRPNALHKQD